MPVDLVGHRQGRGVAQDHVGVPDPGAGQGQTRREGEVVHEDRIGPHALDDADHPVGHPLRLPQDLVDGEYRLGVGLYDPVTGVRLGDRVILDTPVPVSTGEGCLCP